MKREAEQTGRKALDEELRRDPVTVRLNLLERQRAQDIGHGRVSEGVRRALDQHVSAEAVQDVLEEDPALGGETRTLSLDLDGHCRVEISITPLRPKNGVSDEIGNRRCEES